MAALSFEHKQMVSGNSRWLLTPSLSQLHAQIQSTMSTYEIYDDILRYVLEFVANSGKDNLQTLAAFRAASKRTAPLADPLFFRDIKIMLSDERGREDQETSERRLKNFYEALEGNPEICRFITRFTIKTILKEDSQPSQHWIRTNVHLPLILSHLKHLTHFSLVNRWHPMAWPDVNTNLFKAFQNINQLPKLSYLEFFRIGGFPSGWITTFENLETLKLIDVVLDAQYSIHMFQHSTPQLKDLEISSGAFGVGGFGIHNQLWTDLTGVTRTVERLKIVNDAGDAFVVLASPIFSTFVRFPLLKELEVVVPDLRTREGRSIFGGFSDRYHLESLETIKVTHPFHLVDTIMLPDIIPWVISHPFRSAKTITKIHIVFTPTKPLNEDWRPYGLAQWARIDSLVQQDYTAVRTFILEFQSHDYTQDPRVVEKDVRAMLPRMVENPSIIVRVVLADGTAFEL